MEFLKEFEDWLHEHFVADLCKATSAELEKVLMDTGMSEAEAAKKAEPLYYTMIDNEEDAYVKGIQDGAQLQLQLLGKTPEAKAGAGQLSKIQYKVHNDEDDMEQTMWTKAVADGVFLVEAEYLDEFLKNYPDAVEVERTGPVVRPG